jgi:hypothetical protein
MANIIPASQIPTHDPYGKKLVKCDGNIKNAKNVTTPFSNVVAQGGDTFLTQDTTKKRLILPTNTPT